MWPWHAATLSVKISNDAESLLLLKSAASDVELARLQHAKHPRVCCINKGA